MRRILCFFGWHGSALTMSHPEAKGSNIHFGVTVDCPICKKVFHKVEWNMSFEPGTSVEQAPQFKVYGGEGAPN